MGPKLGQSGSFPGGRMLEEESSLSLWLPHICDKSRLSSHGGSPPRQGRMGSSKRDRASVDPSPRKQVISFESWHFSVSSSDMRFFPSEATFSFVLFSQKSPHKTSLQNPCIHTLSQQLISLVVLPPPQPQTPWATVFCPPPPSPHAHTVEDN